MKKGENDKGFTIIEVALVLAIAGLIFLMVFIALPALRRNAADARRKDDIARLIMAIKKYQSNNRGALPSLPSEGGSVTVGWDDKWSDTNKPTGWGDLYYAYLGQNFTDPDGDSYVIQAEECTGNNGAICSNDSIKDIQHAVFPNGHIMHVLTAATCDGPSARRSANKRKVAVVYKLEGAEAFCSES